MAEQKKAWSRRTIGSLYKAKEGTSGDYFKVYVPEGETLVLKNGDILQFETKQSKIEGINKALASGKLSPENAAKALEYANKIPAYVRGELVQVKRND